jgi:hypothetical protein
MAPVSDFALRPQKKPRTNSGLKAQFSGNQVAGSEDDLNILSFVKSLMPAFNFKFYGLTLPECAVPSTLDC